MSQYAAAADSARSHQGHNVGQIMRHVLLACVPGASALVFCFGWGVLINVLWLGTLAVALEAAILKLRQRPVLPALRDGSAVLTAMLLALALPPTLPWWISLVGIVLAIGIAKHVYGGLGRNPFNPAMAGYAALLLAFPMQMTQWLLPAGVTHGLPSLAAAFDIFCGRELLEGIDAYTGATPLDKFRQHGQQLVSEFWQATPVMGQWSGRGWEWINAGFLFGGLYLWYKRIIGWQISAAFLAALALLAALFYDGGSAASHGSPLLHLFAGGTMLGACFIATDPVTAATTPRGKLIYGALIGALVFAIRAFGHYPDGIAFAVLLGNFAAPFIDAMTQSRSAGAPR